MSGKCKDGAYGMLTMDLIIIDKITSTGKDEKAVRLKPVKEALTSLQGEGRPPIRKPGGEGGC
jgi:hypothetical protein